ncbi:ANTAR domain-containing protein [Streptomyces carpinensis]|uniref:ANTAR domain-containing protein n=1 Tax=Streptomyces carpinensis TaxID=66369 RepID=A0ABV1W5M1_9ACTN|nr:ANTAR domain-containing protein [Streptomyces carpinensis]
MTPQRPDLAADQPEPETDGEIATELALLREENAQQRHALASRPLIDQARGMIMAIGRCTSVEAWPVLMAVSQHGNVQLHTVAQQLVATTADHQLPAPIRRALGQILRASRRR